MENFHGWVGVFGVNLCEWPLTDTGIEVDVPGLFTRGLAGIVMVALLGMLLAYAVLMLFLFKELKGHFDAGGAVDDTDVRIRFFRRRTKDLLHAEAVDHQDVGLASFCMSRSISA